MVLSEEAMEQLDGAPAWPIALMETMLKLFGGWSFRRWVTRSDLPDSQKGGLPGSQAVTCVWSAQQLLHTDYRRGDMPCGSWWMYDKLSIRSTAVSFCSTYWMDRRTRPKKLRLLTIASAVT